jgi:hypothetical protein
MYDLKYFRWCRPQADVRLGCYRERVPSCTSRSWVTGESLSSHRMISEICLSVQRPFSRLRCSTLKRKIAH